MSVRWITWAWDQDCSTAGEKLTLIALADHAGETGVAFPGCARLADKTGQDERTIRRHLDALEKAGRLTRERRRRQDGTLGTYNYQLLNQPPDNLSTGQDARTPPGTMPGSPADTHVRAEPSVLNRQVEPSAPPPTPPASGGEVELVGRMAFDDAFEHWWERYPRKAGKPAAKRALRSALKKAPPEQIGSGLLTWIRYWDQRNDPSFIPYPATWLNQERWNDDPPPLPKSQTQPKLSSGATALQAYIERNR
jgi:DNA-binding transcriptional ArsR family regulator